MSPLQTVFLLAMAFMAVFLETSFDLARDLLGAQIDLLPALAVYAGLTGGVFSISLLAVFGGLCFDALSANPLGVTIVPLFLIGFVILQTRELLLRGSSFARLALGLAASGLAPLLSIFLLLNIGSHPVLGWIWLWKWAVMTVGGGFLTPPLFWVFERLHGALSYPAFSEAVFRADREIKRGRS